MTLLGMIGVSLYGAATLPAEQQVPIHFGPGSYKQLGTQKRRPHTVALQSG